MSDELEYNYLVCDECTIIFTDGHVFLLGSNKKAQYCDDCFSKKFKPKADDGQEDEESDQEDPEGRGNT